MTLHDLKRIHAYWRKHPPLTVMVAAVAATLGVDVQKMAVQDNKSIYMTPEEAMAMQRLTGGKIDGVARL